MSKNFSAFEIAMLIREIYSKTMALVGDNLKESGLTHQQIIVIKLIAHNKEMTISELCEAMSLAKGTVSGIINRMEKMGYVEKVKHKEDMRNTYVRFGKEGLEFAKKFRTTINENFNTMFKNTSEEELIEIAKNLKHILEKLEE